MEWGVLFSDKSICHTVIRQKNVNGDEWRNYHRKACVQYIGLTNKWEVRFLCGRPNNPPEVTADSTGGLISDVVGIKSTRIQECGKTLNSTSRSWCWNILKKRYCLTTLKWIIGLSSWTFAATAQHLCSPCRGQKEPHDQCEPWGEIGSRKASHGSGYQTTQTIAFAAEHHISSHIITSSLKFFERLQIRLAIGTRRKKLKSGQVSGLYRWSQKMRQIIGLVKASRCI
jgi:hypothetical protein